MQFFEKGVVAELRILMQIRLTMGQKLHWKKYSQSKSSLSPLFYSAYTSNRRSLAALSDSLASLLLAAQARLRRHQLAEMRDDVDGCWQPLKSGPPIFGGLICVIMDF